MNGERFTPDMELEMDRLLLVEHALGTEYAPDKGGLVDKHLRWKERGLAPSASLDDKEYGYMPARFAGDREGQRPSREPVDFQEIATDVLGLPYDVRYGDLVSRVNEVDDGWFNFLVQTGRLDEKQVAAMKEAARRVFRMNTHTEDNLPAYTSTIFGGFMAMANGFGIQTSALEEWSRGIWTAEEDGHKISLNEYGKITGITNDRKHIAGRTSLLRSGMEITLEHVTQLFAYVDWQEPSAMLAHDRSAELYGPVGFALQDRVGQDEARHHFVYHNIIEVLFRDPRFSEDVIRTLQAILPAPVMPGSKGAPNYIRESVLIHQSAVFGREQAHEAARMILKKLRLFDESQTPEGLSNEGQAALRSLRDRFSPEVPEVKPRRTIFVLGKTITEKELANARREYAHLVGLPDRFGQPRKHAQRLVPSQ